MSAKIYLDNAGTTQVDGSLLNLISEYQSAKFFNPSSRYFSAKECRRAVDKARRQVAEAINADEKEVIFTSGATEAINSCFYSCMHNCKIANKRARFVSTNVEHSAVYRCLDFLQKYHDCDLETMAVDEKCGLGQLDIAGGGGTLLNVMLVNNELGVIFPISDFSKNKNFFIHSDVSQAVGKMDIDFNNLGLDFMSFTGHKFHAPKGIGVLLVREGVPFLPLLHGGQQENGMRSGTENVSYIVAIGEALAISKKNNRDIFFEMQKLFESEIVSKIDGAVVNCAKSARVGNISNIYFPKVNASDFVLVLDSLGLECSTGSACSQFSKKVSHVLQAIGLSDKKARGCLRFSFSRMNSIEEVRQAVVIVLKGYERLIGNL